MFTKALTPSLLGFTLLLAACGDQGDLGGGYSVSDISINQEVILKREKSGMTPIIGPAVVALSRKRELVGVAVEDTRLVEREQSTSLSLTGECTYWIIDTHLKIEHGPFSTEQMLREILVRGAELRDFRSIARHTSQRCLRLVS